MVRSARTSTTSKLLSVLTAGLLLAALAAPVAVSAVDPVGGVSQAEAGRGAGALDPRQGQAREDP